MGAELFAMTATIVRAQRDVKRGIGSGTPYDVADTFCRASRRRVETLFAGIASNDDAYNYGTARAMLEGRYTWLEEGVVAAPTEAAKSKSETAAKLEPPRTVKVAS